MMKNYIHKLHNKENLTQSEMEQAMISIMSGDAIKDDVAHFLLALRDKGATVEEITGAAKIMRKFVVGIKSSHSRLLDTCGTGGDKTNTFNISTVTALVVAGAGVPVAKHGNRSVSSKCGSADVLEALGVNLNVDENQLKKCLDKIGIAFLFAQKFHPAMKHVAPIRKELGVETIFNILGPLTNPANATHQMIGVYSRDLLEPIAHVLENLGLKKAVVVHGSDGLDEITTTGKTFISEFNGREIITYDIDPTELGISLAKSADLKGGNLDENVKIVTSILNGDLGPKRDIVLINAAYALYISDFVDSIEKGIQLAKESIDSKKAKQKLDALKEFSHAK
ncbi:MAG: anthranilate phosphoribosyltransferase [Candidatus Omnitrophica bacterium]|nr:anthranilate phosphoribosyltransferase [Candidatus Omnitrophota bacterium]